MTDEFPKPPTPDSAAYAQINFIGQGINTHVSGPVNNQMLLVGIAHLMASLVVRTNMSTGNILPPAQVLTGLLQRIQEITPQLVSAVEVRNG